MRRVLGAWLIGGVAILAAQEPPSWGVGLLLGKEEANPGALCGRPVGVELSWHFLQGHWVEGRLRATFLKFGYGAGLETHDASFSSRERLKAEYQILSCDWMCSLRKARGPYLVAGVGWHFGTQEFLEDRAPLQVGLPSSRVQERNASNFLAFTLGAGYRFPRGLEAEVRWDYLPDPSITFQAWGGAADPQRDVAVLGLAVRYRF